MTDVQLGPVTGEKLSGVRQTDRPTSAGWVLRRYRSDPGTAPMPGGGCAR